MAIKLLISGGTIDKTYDSLSGDLGFAGSHFKQMLKQSKTTLNISLKVLFLKDSLIITDNDRKQILSACIRCDERKIIISHGTDTLVKTAQYLAENSLHKTIILFGAIIPYSVADSDALFNLGSALNAVQLLDEGVYINMNGRIFTADNVQKNKHLGVFQEKQKSEGGEQC